MSPCASTILSCGSPTVGAPVCQLTNEELLALFSYLKQLPECSPSLPEPLRELRSRIRAEDGLPWVDSGSPFPPHTEHEPYIREPSPPQSSLCSGCQRRQKHKTAFIPYSPTKPRKRCSRGGERVPKPLREYELSEEPWLPKNAKAIEFIAQLAQESDSSRTHWVEGIRSLLEGGLDAYLQADSPTSLAGILTKCATNQANCVFTQFVHMLQLITLAFAVNESVLPFTVVGYSSFI
jgi:hypothetical protein